MTSFLIQEVSVYARAHDADLFGRGKPEWRFHTAYGPVRVRVAGPNIFGRLENAQGARCAHKERIAGPSGQFSHASVRAWRETMRALGAEADRTIAPDKRMDPHAPSPVPRASIREPRDAPRVAVYRKPQDSSHLRGLAVECIGGTQSARGANHPMTRPTLERIAWLRTPNAMRAKHASGGQAVVMSVEGKRTAILLSDLTLPALKKYASSLGIKV
jgi:hypothetical protein